MGNRRVAQVSRTTTETTIELSLALDEAGESRIDTGVPFFDHMLTLFARHGFFTLQVKAQGDIAVDAHHTVEDVGICLGEAFARAWGDKVGMRRFGEAAVPMGEALAWVVLDVCSRPFLVYNVSLPQGKVGTFDTELVEEFFQAFIRHSGVTLHLHLLYGSNTHHMIEALFKAFGRALAEASTLDPRIQGVLSTKGAL
ncbi:MAG: imidazoleglycerol-phosphate dehydratase HisB [Nitrospinota bacterium]|nr:MAG: imidazoleglycerol-phosphate dehydratase HisB [Nitrospinota bacterium]